ncbi:mechanosensitive ion channel family protein [Nocardiopsis sp. RV163]|uniref:mechanosensitive ion channel family protein n=1 Tax=Nocardiopsis sp. RV163 TaxID=1661388 RepID=UPI00064C15EC|nr:mechanosensitive ion channel family protein [Nocardiopsis sp. RV163]
MPGCATGAELREDPEHGKWLLEDPAVWGVTRRLRRRVKDALDEAGVEMPFPQRTVRTRHDGGPDAGSEGNGHVGGIGRQHG